VQSSRFASRHRFAQTAISINLGNPLQHNLPTSFLSWHLRCQRSSDNEQHNPQGPESASGWRKPWQRQMVHGADQGGGRNDQLRQAAMQGYVGNHGNDRAYQCSRIVVHSRWSYTARADHALCVRMRRAIRSRRETCCARGWAPTRLWAQTPAGAGRQHPVNAHAETFRGGCDMQTAEFAQSAMLVRLAGREPDWSLGSRRSVLHVQAPASAGGRGA